MSEEFTSVRAVLQELIKRSQGYVVVLIDQHGAVLASAGDRSPLGLAQHVLTIAQGMFVMAQATGIATHPETITDIDHGSDGRILISIIQGYYILALRYNPQAPSAHELFRAAALTFEEGL